MERMVYKTIYNEKTEMEEPEIEELEIEKLEIKNMKIKDMKKNNNYLDYVPKHNPRYHYSLNEQNHIEILVPNSGLCNRIAQIFFKRPTCSRVELDHFGSYVWNCINGTLSVYEIGFMVREHFGTKAEPLYERLSCFLMTLQKNGFIQ